MTEEMEGAKQENINTRRSISAEGNVYENHHRERMERIACIVFPFL